MLAGIILGTVLGMLIMSLAVANKMSEQQSLVNLSRHSLANAEDKAKELNLENKVLYTEKKELEATIVDLENNIEMLVNNSKSKKIKELVIDSQEEN